jgi:predicted nuclease with TOPRIM domain
VRIVEEKNKDWLLKDQERRLNQIDELFREYEKLNVTYNNIKVMVADLVKEEARVDENMNNVRYKITVQERKVREINKMLRSNEDPRRMPRGERDGKESL